jgi:serine/threonine protein phosphatase PrpC
MSRGLSVETSRSEWGRKPRRFPPQPALLTPARLPLARILSPRPPSFPISQLAAKVGRASFQAELTRPAALAALRESPRAVLESTFATAHRAIETAFREH